MHHPLRHLHVHQFIHPSIPTHVTVHCSAIHDITLHSYIAWLHWRPPEVLHTSARAQERRSPPSRQPRSARDPRRQPAHAHGRGPLAGAPPAATRLRLGPSGAKGAQSSPCDPSTAQKSISSDRRALARRGEEVVRCPTRAQEPHQARATCPPAGPAVRIAMGAWPRTFIRAAAPAHSHTSPSLARSPIATASSPPTLPHTLHTRTPTPVPLGNSRTPRPTAPVSAATRTLTYLPFLHRCIWPASHHLGIPVCQANMMTHASYPTSQFPRTSEAALEPPNPGKRATVPSSRRRCGFAGRCPHRTSCST